MDQQQIQEETATQEELRSSSGSIGPFFGVISVLMILAILSCVLGRILAGQPIGSLETTIEQRCSWFRWVKRKCSWRCIGNDVETGSRAVVTKVETGDAKAQDGSY